MKFYSTNNRHLQVSLQQAVMEGLANDGGLYMPHEISALPPEFFTDISSMSFTEIAWAVTNHLVGDDLPEDELQKIVEHTIQFDAPLVSIEKNIYALELFHGPTLAFKDFGARFLSALMRHYAKATDKEIVILTATSGDTGSAVANGFLEVEGTRVVVLYPSGKVSDLQEKQFTTLGANITALEVDGTFDDCQALVKQAFLDDQLRNRHNLASANSINIARLIPQTFYYFKAYADLLKEGKDVVFSVPSGNFGNLTAGLFAKKMGLPVRQFIAATNVNDIVPSYLLSGTFVPRKSQETISNAMDVGDPSNFARILDHFDHDHTAVAAALKGYSFTDEQTRGAMRALYVKGYMADPHGAVAYAALHEFMRDQNDVSGVFLETAHPGKFQATVEETLNEKIILPPRLEKFLAAEKSSQRLENDFNAFKEFLLDF